MLSLTYGYLDVSVHRVRPACLWIQHTVIQESRDQYSFDSSPGLFAAFHALHRLLTPRHPPHALNHLATMIKASEHQTLSPEKQLRQQHPDTASHHNVILAFNEQHNTSRILHTQTLQCMHRTHDHCLDRLDATSIAAKLPNNSIEPRKRRSIANEGL